MRRLFLTILLWFWFTLLAVALTLVLLFARAGLGYRSLLRLSLHDLLLFSVAGAIFCYFVRRYLTKPLNKLGEAAANIAEGRLDTRVDPSLIKRHDEIADLQYRFTLSPGVGYYFLRQTNTSLAGELGPAMVFERLGEEDKNYVTLRLAERFEHKFTENNARIWQSAEILPQVNDFNNFVVNAEVGLEAAVYKKISLQAYVQDNFVNEPASGRQQNDLRIVSGLKYKF